MVCCGPRLVDQGNPGFPGNDTRNSAQQRDRWVPASTRSRYLGTRYPVHRFSSGLTHPDDNSFNDAKVMGWILETSTDPDNKCSYLTM
jgi:hypothetical protein